MDDTLYLRAKHGERGNYKAKFTTDGFDRWAASTSPSREGQMEKIPDEEVNTTMQGGVFGFKLPSAKSMKKAVGKYGKSALALIDEYSPDISAKARKYAEEGLAMADKYAPGLAKHLQEEVGMAGGGQKSGPTTMIGPNGRPMVSTSQGWKDVETGYLYPIGRGGALKVRLPKKAPAPKKQHKTHGPVVHAGPRHVAPKHVPLAVRAASALGRYHAAKSGDHEYSGDIGDALSQAEAMEMAMHGGLSLKSLGKFAKKAMKVGKKAVRVAKAVAPHALEAYEAYHEARAPRHRPARRSRHAPEEEEMDAEMEHEAEMEAMHGGLSFKSLGKFAKKAMKVGKKAVRVAKAVAPHALEAYEAYHEARAPRHRPARRSRHAEDEMDAEMEHEAEMEEMHGGLKFGKLLSKAMKVGKKAVKVAKRVAPHALEAYEAYHEARAPRHRPARRSRHDEEDEAEMEHEAEMEAMHGGIIPGTRGRRRRGGAELSQDDMARMLNQKKGGLGPPGVVIDNAKLESYRPLTNINRDREGTGGGKKKSARGAVVSQIMRERGVSLPEASRIVKAEGLY